MSKTISHVSQLPDWFRLENYDSAKDLDAKGWLLQLLVRYLYKHGIDNYDSAMEPNAIKEIKQIQKEGVVKKSIAFDPLANSSIGSLAVREPTVFDLLLMMQRLRSSISGADKIIQKFNDHKERDFTDVEKAITRKPASEFSGWLTLDVNLSFPDSLLIKQFTSLLNDMRAKHGADISKPMQRKPDFEGWVKAGVLPYLDLTYWAHSQGMHITYRCMADAIFPYGEGGDETVRKTTKAIAEKMLDDCTFSYVLELSQAKQTE